MSYDLKSLLGSYRYHRDIPKLIPFMILNVIVSILTPILMAAGLLMAGSRR